MSMLSLNSYFEQIVELFPNENRVAIDSPQAEKLHKIFNLALQNFNFFSEDLRAEAKRFCKLAANKGCVHALFILGCLIDRKNNSQATRDKALALYKQAAEQGNAEAQNSLGMHYHDEAIHGNRDFTEAFRFYKLAAEQGHVDALCQLAIFYWRGIGDTMDIKEAIRLFTLATDLCHPEDSEPWIYLGMIYRDLNKKAEYVHCLKQVFDKGDVNYEVELIELLNTEISEEKSLGT
jgi:TPR repeat protein